MRLTLLDRAGSVDGFHSCEGKTLDELPPIAVTWVVGRRVVRAQKSSHGVH